MAVGPGPHLQRYVTDAWFHQLVDQIALAIMDGPTTAQDVRDAADVADYIVTCRRLEQAAADDSGPVPPGDRWGRGG